jgi:hypothetical protein
MNWLGNIWQKVINFIENNEENQNNRI